MIAVIHHMPNQIECTSSPSLDNENDVSFNSDWHYYNKILSDYDALSIPKPKREFHPSPIEMSFSLRLIPVQLNGRGENLQDQVVLNWVEDGIGSINGYATLHQSNSVGYTGLEVGYELTPSSVISLKFGSISGSTDVKPLGLKYNLSASAHSAGIGIRKFTQNLDSQNISLGLEMNLELFYADLSLKPTLPLPEYYWKGIGLSASIGLLLRIPLHHKFENLNTPSILELGPAYQWASVGFAEVENTPTFTIRLVCPIPRN